jgi:hypothetical protein
MKKKKGASQKESVTHRRRGGNVDRKAQIGVM